MAFSPFPLLEFSLTQNRTSFYVLGLIAQAPSAAKSLERFGWSALNGPGIALPLLQGASPFFRIKHWPLAASWCTTGPRIPPFEGDEVSQTLLQQIVILSNSIKSDAALKVIKA